jgi:rSAM/selenodomain-associated transferase 2
LDRGLTERWIAERGAAVPQGRTCYPEIPVKIAVVIPALDEADRIQPSIESAHAPEVDVLVVDGGSRDSTREVAREAGARVIPSRPGRAPQLATGVAETTAEVVLFLHSDTRLPEGWVDAVRGALADPAVAGGAFAFSFGADESRSRATRALLAFVEWGVRLRLTLLGLPYGDQGLFARRTALVAAGGVPQVPIMEDLDLVAALRRQGEIRLLSEPVVTSARRYLARGVLRTMLRNWLALAAWRLGLPRDAVARWYAGAGSAGPSGKTVR